MPPKLYIYYTKISNWNKNQLKIFNIFHTALYAINFDKNTSSLACLCPLLDEASTIEYNGVKILRFINEKINKQEISLRGLMVFLK